MTSKFLSVIIPVYNEDQRLQNLHHIAEYLQQQPYTYELLVVDDGSEEVYHKKLLAYQKQYGFRVITYTPNKGKGFAIKTGMLAAEGQYLLFLDVDLSTPIETIDEVFSRYKDISVVIGSRKMPGAHVSQHQSFLRETMGKVFTRLSQLITGVWVTDFTCGFKCFSQEAGKNIFQRVHINRWGFDAEVLFLAKKLGYPVQEIPVSWKDEKHTKVKFPQDVIRSFIELLLVRIYDSTGKYQ